METKRGTGALVDGDEVGRGDEERSQLRFVVGRGAWVRGLVGLWVEIGDGGI